MPSLMLNARFVATVKPSPKRVEYCDTNVSGLALRVTPGGAKTYVVRYRNKHARQRRLTLGGTDVLSLAKASKSGPSLGNGHGAPTTIS